MSINLENLLLKIDNAQSKEIKAFKKRVYFLMNDLKKYVSSIDKGLENKYKELVEIKKEISKIKIIDEDKILNKKIKSPDEKILKNMLIATEGLLKFNSDGIHLGSLSLGYLKSFKSFKKTDEKKLSKIQHIMINLGEKYLRKLPLKDIGLRLETNKKQIYKDGFRIFHKKPDWEKDIVPQSIENLNYKSDVIFKRSEDLISLYTKNRPFLKTLISNTEAIQSLVYENCDKALEGLDKNEDIYMKLFYVIKNLFYVNEIVSLKCHMWLNKTMKYHIVAAKAFL